MSKSDVYEIVTEQVVESLENGVMPWNRPWVASVVMPTNAATERPYSGVNILLLWLAAAAEDFASPYWVTYKQAQKMGGQVRKGESSTLVTFFKMKTITDEDDNGDEVKKTIPICRYYRVFNAEQCDGIEVPKAEVLCESERIAAADAFFASIDANLTHGGHRACYAPTKDTIRLPEFTAFKDPRGYYATVAHEFVHWTGHPTRLDRDLTGRFGDASYAAEELIAELGAAFVTARLGFAYSPQAASYIASWLEVLKTDKYAIFTAAREAAQAADHLLKRGNPLHLSPLPQPEITT